MRRTLLILFLFRISLVQYGQIVADHTVVDKYDDIPQYYIDQVKKMLLVVAGESHALGYMRGMTGLESLNPVYNVSYTATPEAYTTQHLRISKTTWGDVNNETGWLNGYGEEDWYKTALAVSRTKAGISYYASQGIPVSAFGFGWCYDGAERDMGPYLDATQQYIDYCAANAINTKVFFTTGPAERLNAEGETGYYKYLAHEAIRSYVRSNTTRILFDYADILCYDDDGSGPPTATWNGHTFPVITSANSIPEGPGHISPAGELRIAKAMWWMLARMAGWDGGTSNVPVSGITVTGAGGLSAISTDNGTLQLTATVTPTNATNKTVTWSITNGTGQATINSSGLVTAQSNGTVTAKATANDGSGVSGTLVITISNQSIPVSGIAITGTGGSSLITTDNGNLQLTAAVTPSNATNKTVTWSITNGTGQATISSSGLVTAQSNGTVTAKATANDGSGVFGTLVITISNQVIPVTGIAVTGTGGSSLITTDNGNLQLTAAVTPSNATNKTVTWSISNGTGQATINSSGLVTAQSNGTVTARATANDGSGVFGTLVITISNQVIQVTGIAVTGTGGSSSITTNNGSLQLTAAVTPSNATNKTVTWSISNGTGQATINSSGLVTAQSNGTVTARATANDGSGVFGTLVITISNQVIPVSGIVLISGITVTSAGNLSLISIDNGTLQLIATIVPANATNMSLTWSILNGTGQATISQTGLVSAESNGTVTARATANDGSGKFGQLVIEISNQTVHVTNIEIAVEGGERSVKKDKSYLQLDAYIFPEYATNRTVTWSLLYGKGSARISSDGLLTILSEGNVIVKAEANDGSGVFDTLAIEIEKVDPIKAYISTSEIRVHVPERFVDSRISLFGLNGYLYETKRVDNIEMILDASRLTPGIYFITVQNALILDVVKVVKIQ
jgi:uncharacterized protein YjdB